MQVIRPTASSSTRPSDCSTLLVSWWQTCAPARPWLLKGKIWNGFTCLFFTTFPCKHLANSKGNHSNHTSRLSCVKFMGDFSLIPCLSFFVWLLSVAYTFIRHLSHLHLLTLLLYFCLQLFRCSLISFLSLPHSSKLLLGWSTFLPNQPLVKECLHEQTFIYHTKQQHDLKWSSRVVFIELLPLK